MHRTPRLAGASQALAVVLVGVVGAVGAVALRLAVVRGVLGSAAAVLVAAGTLISLSNAFAGLVILLFVSVIDGFLKALSPSFFVLLIKDYFLGLCLLGWLLRRALREPSEAMSQRLAAPILLFTAFVIAQVSNPNAPDLRTALAGVRAWVIWLPLFFIAYDVISTRKRFDWLLGAMLASALLMAVYGLFQYAFGFEHLFGLSETFRDYAARYGWWSAEGVMTRRVFSTTVSPGTLGSAMAMCGLLAVGAFYYWRSRASRLLAMGTAATCFTTMVLSGTRSALVAGLFGGIAMLLVARRPRLLLAAGLIALVVGEWASAASGGAIGERVATLWEDRAYTIERPTYPLLRGFAVAIDYPMGVGVGTGVGVADRLQARIEQHEVGLIENEFGRAFAELGLPGGLLFIYLVWTIVVQLYNAQRQLKSPRFRMMALGMFGASLAVMSQLMVGAAFYGAPPAPFFWCIVAAQLRFGQFEAQATAAQQRTESARARDLHPAASR